MSINIPIASPAVQPVARPVTGASPLANALPQDLSEVSPPGLLLSQLELLQQSNPTEFQQVVAQIAETLRRAASEQSGASAQSLQAAAKDFAAASKTGQLSAPNATTAVTAPTSAIAPTGPWLPPNPERRIDHPGGDRAGPWHVFRRQPAHSLTSPRRVWTPGSPPRIEGARGPNPPEFLDRRTGFEGRIMDIQQ